MTATSEVDIHKALNSFNSKRCCSVPESFKSSCSKRIVKAHSVSKSSALKSIAENGHVLTMFNTGRNKNRYNKNIEPESVGINRASTFSGFCSHHDKQLFSPIEDKEFSSNSHHCFLVAYRALSRELFVKESSDKVFELTKELDKGKPIQEQVMIQKMASHYGLNNSLTISDLKYLKSKLDCMLVTKQYDEMSHFVIELESAPMLMGSAVVGSEIDFNGNILQIPTNDPNVIPDYTFINSFASNGKGYLVLSWFNEQSKSNIKLIEQIKAHPEPADCVANFMVLSIENLYLSPLWWEQKDNSEKLYFCAMYAQGATEDTDIEALKNQKQLGIGKIKNTVHLGTAL